VPSGSGSVRRNEGGRSSIDSYRIYRTSTRVSGGPVRYTLLRTVRPWISLLPSCSAAGKSRVLNGGVFNSGLLAVDEAPTPGLPYELRRRRAGFDRCGGPRAICDRLWAAPPGVSLPRAAWLRVRGGPTRLVRVGGDRGNRTRTGSARTSSLGVRLLPPPRPTCGADLIEKWPAPTGTCPFPGQVPRQRRATSATPAHPGHPARRPGNRAGPRQMGRGRAGNDRGGPATPGWAGQRPRVGQQRPGRAGPNAPNGAGREKTLAPGVGGRDLASWCSRDRLMAHQPHVADRSGATPGSMHRGWRADPGAPSPRPSCGPNWSANGRRYGPFSGSEAGRVRLVDEGLRLLFGYLFGRFPQIAGSGWPGADPCSPRAGRESCAGYIRAVAGRRANWSGIP